MEDPCPISAANYAPPQEAIYKSSRIICITLLPKGTSYDQSLIVLQAIHRWIHIDF